MYKHTKTKLIDNEMQRVEEGLLEVLGPMAQWDKKRKKEKNDLFMEK